MRNSSRLNIFLKFSNVLPISKSITKMILGKFSVDCRKTKTKLNTTTSQNKGRSHHLPMVTCSRRGKKEAVKLGLVLALYLIILIG